MKNKLTLQPKKAFTLVELIVVVTILAIIWTIWFVSYTDYLSWVRDTNRTVQLESIWDWLKLSLTKWRLPIPDDYIEVKTSWDTIAYQGYAWEEVLKKIKYDKEGKDPLDNTYFSYYATDNRKNFQLMALLEETGETVSLHNRREVLSNDIDYADRQVKVSWKKLWILTGGWDNLNVPVQEIWEIKDNWELDIATTPEEYISHIDDIDKISWSWSELIKSIYNSSCKRILESSLDNWDWIYKINPSWNDEFEVYCDMSTDGGGWQLVATNTWPVNDYNNWRTTTRDQWWCPLKVFGENWACQTNWNRWEEWHHRYSDWRWISVLEPRFKNQIEDIMHNNITWYPHSIENDLFINRSNVSWLDNKNCWNSRLMYWGHYNTISDVDIRYCGDNNNKDSRWHFIIDSSWLNKWWWDWSRGYENIASSWFIR